MMVREICAEIVAQREGELTTVKTNYSATHIVTYPDR